MGGAGGRGRGIALFVRHRRSDVRRVESTTDHPWVGTQPRIDGGQSDLVSVHCCGKSRDQLAPDLDGGAKQEEIRAQPTAMAVTATPWLVAGRGRRAMMWFHIPQRAATWCGHCSWILRVQVDAHQQKNERKLPQRRPSLCVHSRQLSRPHDPHPRWAPVRACCSHHRNSATPPRAVTGDWRAYLYAIQIQ